MKLTKTLLSLSVFLGFATAFSAENTTAAQPQPLTLKAANGVYSYQEKLQKPEDFIKNLHKATPKQPLIVQKGAIRLQGRKGGAIKYEAVQKVVFDGGKVKNIKLQLNGFADKTNWACYFMAGISVDGKTVKMITSDPKKKGQTVTAELNVPEGTAECYLHFTLGNSSGVFRKGVAPASMSGYKLTAK